MSTPPNSKTVSQWNETYDRYVGHYSRHQKSTERHFVSGDPTFVVDADIGRSVDFTRIGVHHIILPPNCRTSLPHAESLEEEFVFVLKGSPHLWLNGYIHALREHDAVGFPAGTGICHTIINNTGSDVHLLVVGEQTKAENRCVYPLNQELKETFKIWWDNAPPQIMGPHSGLPGLISRSDWGVPSEVIIHCPAEPRRVPFHYPGDNESFGVGFRISDKLRLKELGIWYEILPPGTRSAFPHAHTHEEEFVFVVQGTPTVWLDGFATQMSPGYFAAFPPNTGIAHVIINDTDQEVVYICIGEAKDFPDEKITYPKNTLRQRECERKGWCWLDAPKRLEGNAALYPRNFMTGHLVFRPSEETSTKDVLAIFQKSPSYFLSVDGCLPSLEMAKKSMIDGPRQRSEKYFKEFLIIELDNEAIGVLDLHVNHPEEGSCYLGLLLITESRFRHGHGTRCYQLAEDYVKRAFGCKKIMLGVSQANDVIPFWAKQGFVRTGRTYAWPGETKASVIHEFEKTIL